MSVSQMGNAQNEYSIKREKMVTDQIEMRGVKDNLVLSAMRKVPRHEFVPEDKKKYAYEDTPLEIGEDQTISQP
ncbi:MAG: protein-L-isoaspartate O-methyltransferase family protein, partial [Candidatus Poribacteria bacterium]